MTLPAKAKCTAFENIPTEECTHLLSAVPLKNSAKTNWSQYRRPGQRLMIVDVLQSTCWHQWASFQGGVIQLLNQTWKHPLIEQLKFAINHRVRSSCPYLRLVASMVSWNASRTPWHLRTKKRCALQIKQNDVWLLLGGWVRGSVPQRVRTPVPYPTCMQARIKF